MYIFIFTYKSPFSEVPEFIEEEIKYWSSTTKLIMISLADDDEKVVKGLFGYSNIDAYAVSPNTIGSTFRIITQSINYRFLSELAKAILQKPVRTLKGRIKLLFSYEFVAHRYCLGYKRIQGFYNLTNEQVILYSYWLGPGTMAAIEIKKRSLRSSNFTIVTRAHGSDLYPYANNTNWLPYLEHNINKCDYIYPISSHGESFIAEKFKVPQSKISLSRLGIPNYNLDRKLPIRTRVFHIVSCSYLSPVKRVNLIVEALSQISDRKIKWTHIGGGELEAAINNDIALNLRNKTNLEVKLAGNMQNNEVITFYKEHNVNLFVNVSQSEGIPVSMMEASCFGIPILAGDVGGIREILINGYNGILMKSNYSTEEIANGIVRLINYDEKDYMRLCQNALNQFNVFYDAKINYINFTNSILENQSNLNNYN